MEVALWEHSTKKEWVCWLDGMCKTEDFYCLFKNSSLSLSLTLPPHIAMGFPTGSKPKYLNSQLCGQIVENREAEETSEKCEVFHTALKKSLKFCNQACCVFKRRKNIFLLQILYTSIPAKPDLYRFRVR